MYSKKRNTFLFLMLLSLTGIYSTCHKHLDCRETFYNFEMGIKAYPDKDSVHVGDTIWLEVNEPTTLKDVQTGTMVDYSGAANLGTSIAFQEYTSTTGQFTISAVAKFKFFVVKGVNVINTSPDLYKEYFFVEENVRYIFRLGVIPTETGVFRLGFSNASSVVRKSDRCTKAFFSLNFKNTNQHFYFYPGGAGTPSGGGTYYFKVY